MEIYNNKVYNIQCNGLHLHCNKPETLKGPKPSISWFLSRCLDKMYYNCLFTYQPVEFVCLFVYFMRLVYHPIPQRMWFKAATQFQIERKAL